MHIEESFHTRRLLFRRSVREFMYKIIDFVPDNLVCSSAVTLLPHFLSVAGPTAYSIPRSTVLTIRPTPPPLQIDQIIV